MSPPPSWGWALLWGGSSEFFGRTIISAKSKNLGETNFTNCLGEQGDKMNKKVTGTSYQLVRNESMQAIKGSELNALMKLAPKLNHKLTPDEKRDLQNLLFLIITESFELNDVESSCDDSCGYLAHTCTRE